MMFLLKSCKSTKPLNLSLFTILKDTKKTSISIFSHISTNSNLHENDDLESVIKDKILFNTVIQTKNIKIGYFQNLKRIAERKLSIDKIQPLPLSLKYLYESNSEPKHEQLSTEKNKNHKQIQFPYSNSSNSINEVHSIGEKSDKRENTPEGIDQDIRTRNEDFRNWMNSYDNLECDIIKDGENNVIHYGTPDPHSEISDVPCGGCGAFLHCKDTAIPGYIPSEIFKNTGKLGAERLEAIICQRCFFLKEHDIALQVRVSADDYPKVLMSINKKKALVVLMVDLTDFPCSIWPGIADILGAKAPIIVVGNKIDLLPNDGAKYLLHIKQKLYEQIKMSGFGTANILDVTLVSAKTGYGVEELITSLQKLWQFKDVYLVGCTNVGKSSLFNALLQSDYCKFQVSDLIQRATTSQWPGTTLNLLKFPIMRVSHYRIYMRTNRLIEMNKRLVAEEERRQDLLQSQNTPANATLIGRIERTFSQHFNKPEKADNFTTQVDLNATGIKMGLKEHHPDFASSRWCYDTPGVVHPDQILDLLTLDELILTLPKELIRPETFCVKPGTSVFIAGLARLDYINGPDPIRLTVFRSNELPITICKMDLAEKIYSDCLGSNLFKVPVEGTDRLEKWPGLQAAKQFVVRGSANKFSSKDVVLSNAGWIAVNCSRRDYIFQAWTPEKRGIHLRDSVLPRAVTLRGKRIIGSIAYEPHRFI